MNETSADHVADPPEELLMQVAIGNRAAFEALYRSTADRLYAICLRVLGERSEAEEILQEVYTALWRKAAQYDVRYGSVMSWLAISARNRAIDRLRTRPSRDLFESIDVAAAVVDPAASPLQQAETLSDRDRLGHCLEQLEPRRRSLIREAFFGGLTYEELATRIQAPLGSVKSWVRRGLLQLRSCLES